MEEELKKILGTEKEIYKRFPILLISYVFYHVAIYYKMADNPVYKPNLAYVFLALTIHVAHVILIKYLHFEENYPYAWLTALIPITIIALFIKYRERKLKKDEEKLESIKQQIRDEYENQMIQVPQTEFTQAERVNQSPYSQRQMMPDEFNAPLGGSTDMMYSVNNGFPESNYFHTQNNMHNNVVDAADPYAHMNY